MEPDAEVEAESTRAMGCSRVTRRKVTLDEYKKRKGAAPPHDANAVGTQKESPPEGATAAPTPQPQSFIPQIGDAQLMDMGRSVRLSSIPDPTQIGKGTATLDDMKKRIYGKKFAGSSLDEDELPPPPPPPGKPPQRTAPPPPQKEETRMSLAERLRTEFGFDSDPEPTLKNDATTAPAETALYGTPVLGPPGTFQPFPVPPPAPGIRRMGAPLPPPPPIDPSTFLEMFQKTRPPMNGTGAGKR